VGRYLPRELRIKLYNDVVALRRGGLTYRAIIGEVWRRYGARISKSHISYWLRGIHSPYNGRRIPSLELLKPSEELAYVIGVKVGDGYVGKKSRVRKGYNPVWIGLKAKDREFVEGFGRCLAKVIVRRQIRSRFRDDVGKYVVEVGSKTLYELLRKPVDLDRLKKYIEHLRDAWQHSSWTSRTLKDVLTRGYISIYNTDLRLLTYINDLLRRLGIESTGPMLKARRGTIFYDPRRRKKYTRNKDVYVICIRVSSNTNFYRYVGFAMTMKQARLENYVKRNTGAFTLPQPFPNHPQNNN
jgi:intein-encoded DNA endonuclease-like protein